MTNPLEDYLTLRKEAVGPQGVLPGMSGFLRSGIGGRIAEGATDAVGKGFGNAVGQGIGQGAMGLAATGLGVAALKTYQALRKRHDFREMLEHNPDLSEYHEQDPARFNAHYNSLRVMIPAYAQDPIIAGSLMRQMSVNPENAGHHLMQGLENRAKTGPSYAAETPGGKLSLRL